MSDRPYVRVYYADMIRDHLDVWDDDAALAAWLRLLVIADGSWPAPAELPRSLKAKVLDTLAKPDGLVIPEGAHRFRIKGLDAERSARRNAASNAAALRWHSGADTAGIKRGNAPAMPNRTEPNQAKPSRTEEGERDSLDTYHELTGWRPWGIWSGDQIRGAQTEYTDAKVDAALRAEYAEKPDRDSLLKRTLARLARDAERSRQEAKDRPRPKRPPEDRAAVNAELKRLMVVKVEDQPA